MPKGSLPGERKGGRPPGVPNKVTTEARRVALAFLDRRTDEEIDELWAQAKVESPEKALRMYLGAIEFVLPKLSRIERAVTDVTDEELLAEIRRRKAEAEREKEEP